MSIQTQLLDVFSDEIDTIQVDKESDLHGARAIKVIVNLNTGQRVEGLFTKDAHPSFGGVVFSSQKDVGRLMVAKVNSVLKGTAEL